MAKVGELLSQSMFWGKKSQTETPAPEAVPATPARLGDASAQLTKSLVEPTGYFSRYGYPIPIHDIASRQAFVTCFDRHTKNPVWVIEHLTKASRNARSGDRGNSVFKEDTSIPEKFRARLSDYFRSGYDRGHQAPAADAKFSQQAMDETFYLTNMTPQVGEGFNRDYWAHFERFCRNLTDTYSSVRIITGPLYLPKRHPDGKWRVTYEMIGNPPNVAVPTHFFKIVVGEDPIQPSLPRNGAAVGAFVLPNEPISNSTPLKSFYVPLDAIERSSGVEYMPKLPESQRRDLCREVKCDVEVIEFNNAVKSLPAPRK